MPVKRKQPVPKEEKDQVTQLKRALSQYETDPLKHDRLTERRCKACQYLRPIRPSKHKGHCMLCPKEVPASQTLCVGCARLHDSCKECGAVFDPNAQSTPKEDWKRRNMVDAEFANLDRAVRLAKGLENLEKDVLKKFRLKRTMCAFCYYVERHHDKESPIQKLHTCPSCSELVATVKDAPFAYCEACAYDNQDCRYCGIPLDNE